MHDRADRLSLLARVSATLEAIPVPYALIGALALTVHGVTRSTFDLDLLAVDPVCLEPRIWSEIAAAGVKVEIRRGDSSDPLAGVVRFETPGELPLDLVIGKHKWQTKTIERSERTVFAGVEVPILSAVDLILLKLYAGGPQDAWDIQQLLAGPERESLVQGVEQELTKLPRACSELWRRILSFGV
ncbi:MAG TPA: hypothetical protein VF173_09570 [Thermoanaerobaculia bacterium]|nr:hypothetical protein [Thermoanaerobaculia bacterium]